MKSYRSRIVVGMVGCLSLLTGCYGVDQPAESPQRPVVQDMEIRPPADDAKIPLQ